jgi:NifU-like protein involved in Fe-S cluster formation
MKLQIRVNENGIISDVKFKTFGCGSAIASSSYMTERVMGLSLDDASKIKNTEIAKELCLPPVKLHCSSKRPLAAVATFVSDMLHFPQCWPRTPSGLPFGTIVPNGTV